MYQYDSQTNLKQSAAISNRRLHTKRKTTIVKYSYMGN